MKTIVVAGATLLDFGDCPLVVVPDGATPALVGNPQAANELEAGVPVGGFQRFQTRSGRDAVRVLAGTGYVLCYRPYGAGDRSWQDWDDRRPATSPHGDVLGVAVATSRGGGCWAELTIVPTDGYLTAEQARYAEDLAEIERG